jgi:hypothetical protein
MTKQIENLLEELGYDRLHTFEKGWHLVNGINRRGWFIATINGWKFIGFTLQDCLNNLQMKVDEITYRQENVFKVEIS